MPFFRVAQRCFTTHSSSSSGHLPRALTARKAPSQDLQLLWIASHIPGYGGALLEGVLHPHQAASARAVKTAAQVRSDGGDTEEGADRSRGRKQRGKKSKGKRAAEDEEMNEVVVADEVEYVEDIGGGGIDATSAALQQQQQEQRQEQPLRPKRADRGRRGALLDVWSVDGDESKGSGSGRRGERPVFRGPREKLSVSELEQRELLGGAIKAATDWKALAAFVDTKGAAMDAEQAVSVLFKLSCTPQQDSKGATRAWNLSGSPEAFGRPSDAAEAAEYDRLLSTLLGWILVLTPTFRPRQVVRCLQALAHMGIVNVEVLTSLRDVIIKQMGNFEAENYGDIAAAFAKLTFYPEQEFVVALMKRSIRKMPAMTAEGLGRLGTGLSGLGCEPSPDWAVAFWQAALDKSTELARRGNQQGTRSLLFALAAFAQAGLQPNQEWVDSFFGTFTNSAIKPVPLKIPTISAMLYALSSLDSKPPDACMTAILDMWKANVMYCSPSDLGQMSLYLSRYLGLPVPQSLGRLLLSATLRHAARMSGDDLAAVTYLLGASGFRGYDKPVDDLVFVLSQRLGDCSASGLEMVCNGLPRLGNSPRLMEVAGMAARGIAGQQENLPVPDPVPA